MQKLFQHQRWVSATKLRLKRRPPEGLTLNVEVIPEVRTQMLVRTQTYANPHHKPNKLTKSEREIKHIWKRKFGKRFRTQTQDVINWYRKEERQLMYTAQKREGTHPWWNMLQNRQLTENQIFYNLMTQNHHGGKWEYVLIELLWIFCWKASSRNCRHPPSHMRPSVVMHQEEPRTHSSSIWFPSSPQDLILKPDGPTAKRWRT